MKRTGFILLSLGFLSGSLFSVIDADAVRWGYVIPSLLVALVGVVLARLGARTVIATDDRITAGMAQVKTSLDTLVDHLKELIRQQEAIDVYDVRLRIDELLRDDVNTIVESREMLKHVWGLQPFADFMSHFSAGERYMNRVWSASADGYVDEVRRYLATSLEQFEAAREGFVTR